MQPYNAVLGFHDLIENTDAVMYIDNEALYDLSFRVLNLCSPNYSDLSHIIASAMAGATCTFRSPGQLTATMRKLSTNLVPFSRLHFMQLSLAPLTPPSRAASTAVPDLMQQLFSGSSLLAACDPRRGRYLAACAMFRGAASALQVRRRSSALSKLAHTRCAGCRAGGAAERKPARPVCALAPSKHPDRGLQHRPKRARHCCSVAGQFK